MLKHLTIRDFALIRSISFDCGEGLTIISGETGAGKSILLDALSALCGSRGSRDMVRKGSSGAYIEAVFDSAYAMIPQPLQLSLGFSDEEIEEDRLFVSREIDKDGRSTARINGRAVSITVLRELTDALFAIHAQNEQVSLFDEKVQARILDSFAGDELLRALAQWRKLRHERIEGIKILKTLGMNPAERERRLDLLDYQIQEIEAADFKPGETAALKERFRQLSAAERIRDDLYACAQILQSEEGASVSELVNTAAARLNFASGFGKAFEDIQVNLFRINEECSVLLRDILDRAETVLPESGELEQITERLNLWDKMSLKYGGSEEQLFSFLEEAKAERRSLLEGEERFAGIRKRLLESEHEAEEAALKLHELRLKAGRKMSDIIGERLRELNMPRVRFAVSVESAESGTPQYWSESGRDKVSFLISPNLGEDMMPLAKIASGGEASRVLLAVKSMLAECDAIPVLIFDEIDTGISGDTALKVGKSLYELSRGRQVLAVSHMAQIAAFADHHYYIFKEECEGRTETRIQILDENNRKTELARLLSGRPGDIKSLELAAAVLEHARQLKENKGSN